MNDDVDIAFVPAKLLYGIGSGDILRAGGPNAERIAACVYMEGARRAYLESGGPDLPWASVSPEYFIELCKGLYISGALDQNGLEVSPDEALSTLGIEP